MLTSAACVTHLSTRRVPTASSESCNRAGSKGTAFPGLAVAKPSEDDAVFPFAARIAPPLPFAARRRRSYYKVEGRLSGLERYWRSFSSNSFVLRGHRRRANLRKDTISST